MHIIESTIVTVSGVLLMSVIGIVAFVLFSIVCILEWIDEQGREY